MNGRLAPPQTRRRIVQFSALGLTLLALACSSLIAPPSRTAAPASPTAPAATSTLRATPTHGARQTADPTESAAATELPADVGAPGLGDPYFPLMGNGGYDAQHYTLDLAVDMARNVIDGTVTIEAQATQPLERFNLDFAGLDIAEVRVDGEAAEYARDGGELEITPAEPLEVGQSFTVAVTYSGTPGEALPANVPEYSVGWQYYQDGVLVAGEPGGGAGWYPVNEHPLDKATYTFRITVPEPFEVAANGVLVDTERSGDQVTYTWQENDPAASYLITLAIGDFNVRTAQTSSGVPIRNYFAVGVPQSAIHAFDRLPEMIDYYETIFGPYPFEVAGAVVHNLRLNFALETQTLILFGADFVDEGVVSHELAHQWFGDSVSLAGWQNIWLNEGFATYASVLWAEHVDGAAAAEDQLRSYYQDMDSGGFNSVLIGDPGPDDLFDWAVYARGALTLHALRREVGDEAFFDILRAYTDRYRGGNAATADFVAVAEEVSGRPLDDFFQSWLFDQDLPDFPELSG